VNYDIYNIYIYLIYRYRYIYRYVCVYIYIYRCIKWSSTTTNLDGERRCEDIGRMRDLSRLWQELIAIQSQIESTGLPIMKRRPVHEGKEGVDARHKMPGCGDREKRVEEENALGTFHDEALVCFPKEWRKYVP
jgi:hypothetical protein